MWVQLRPGTDTALLMAWINVIIEEGLYNEALWSNGPSVSTNSGRGGGIYT
jgi:predicted molibdopterin-dependent oxidoreductase YjgC